jgi:hypothetical protein
LPASISKLDHSRKLPNKACKDLTSWTANKDKTSFQLHLVLEFNFAFQELVLVQHLLKSGFALMSRSMALSQWYHREVDLMFGGPAVALK